MEDIINIITKSEKRQRARKADKLPAFKSAVGLIIGDLLIGLHTREAGWHYLSMSTSAFSDRPVGYKTFKPIVETMEAVGLIEVSLGRNSKNIQFDKNDKATYSPGFATRFKPTLLPAKMADEEGVDGGGGANLKHYHTPHIAHESQTQAFSVQSRSVLRCFPY